MILSRVHPFRPRRRCPVRPGQKRQTAASYHDSPACPTSRRSLVEAPPRIHHAGVQSSCSEASVRPSWLISWPCRHLHARSGRSHKPPHRWPGKSPRRRDVISHCQALQWEWRRGSLSRCFSFRASVIGVSINPGATQFTVIPRDRHLLASPRLGEAHHPRLGGDVVALAGIAGDADDRGDPDDAAVPSLHHAAQGAAGRCGTRPSG